MLTKEQIIRGYIDTGRTKEAAEVLAEIDSSNLPSPFKDDVKAVWELGLGLIPPGEVVWETGKIVTSIDFGLESFIQPTDTSPSLEVKVLAVTDSEKSAPVVVPLAFDRGLPLGMNPLRDYPISRKTTRAGNEVHLDRIITLEDYLKERLRIDKADLSIISNIPVYSAIAFLPVPMQKSDYEVNIVPSMVFSNGVFAYYLVIQDRALEIGQVGGAPASSRERDLMDRGEGETNPYIRSFFVPSLSDFEKAIIGFGEYSGHLIIVALPYEKPYQEPDFPFGDRYKDLGMLGLGDFFGGEQSRLSMSFRSVRVGRTAFGRGADSGTKSRYVDLKYDSSRIPHIYHVIGLGVQRETKEALTPDSVTKIFQEMGKPVPK